jgi:uncharacterized glyoxalase superfamily protein PhnB
MDHVGIVVDDLAATTAFFAELDGAVVVVDVGSDRVAPAGGGSTHLSEVRVPDVDAAFACARDEGARVVETLKTWEYGERSVSQRIRPATGGS